MSLTPLEVKKQEFDRVFRGYDPVAVDAFLELVSETMGELVVRIAALEERLQAAQSLVADYRQMERALKETMTTTQRQADEARRAVEREAEVRRREAQVEAERIVAEAEARRTTLERRIEELESSERAFVRRLKGILDDHRKTLESHPLRVVGREPPDAEEARGG